MVGTNRRIWSASSASRESNVEDNGMDELDKPHRRGRGPGQEESGEAAEIESISAPLSHTSTSSNVGTSQADAVTAPLSSLTMTSSQQNHITHTQSAASHVSTQSLRLPDFEVIFDPSDRENPRNWPLWYRSWIVPCISYSCWLIVLYSTSYTASTPGLVAEFHSSETLVTLGLTTYLLGLATGSLFAAPLSELYGRRWVYLVNLALWCLLIIPCGLGRSLTGIIVIRYFGALFGAAFITNAPGTVVDIAKPEYLALCMSLWSLAPLNGPVTGPLIGGYVYQYLGWRWNNWISLILGGVAFLGVLTCEETYAPVILKRKAARLRKERNDSRYWCQYDTNMSALELIKINLKRPFVLFATEPILWFLNFWVSLLYGILYLCFIAYPVVFSQHRGWSPGATGLSFLGTGLGSVLAIVSEPLLRRLINSQPRDPETGEVRPEASALVMAIGGVLAPLGQLGFSWTCLPVTIHWAAPIAFGIPFGAGNTLCFIYGSNYIASSYSVYAASAMAGNAVIRSIAGGVLPLAGPRMYEVLTPKWAGTLLGLLEVLMIPIPVVFWRYGGRIRARSKVIMQLKDEEDRMEAKRRRWTAQEAREKLKVTGGGKSPEER